MPKRKRKKEKIKKRKNKRKKKTNSRARKPKKIKSKSKKKSKPEEGELIYKTKSECMANASVKYSEVTTSFQNYGFQIESANFECEQDTNSI